MHAKTDSEGTSVDTNWPPAAAAARRQMYYVQSPSNADALDKMSYDDGGSTPALSPSHHYYHCSPIHHSRESSTSRFSASLKNPRGGGGGGGGGGVAGWKHVQLNGGHGEDDDDDDEEFDGGGEKGGGVRVYLLGFCFFLLMCTLFCLILWGASKSYPPKISVKDMVFENFNVQAGNDESGVPTDMLTLNSTVKIHYRNPATFFTVHVSSTPFELHYFDLKLASGQMTKFSQKRKSGRTVVTIVNARQVPLYGGVPVLANAYTKNVHRVSVPLNLTFTLRSRAHILGRLVRSKFYSKVRCQLTLHGNNLGKPHNLTEYCIYG